jgi:hypothetical protein
MRASALGELFDDALRWKARTIDQIYGLTYGRSHLGTSIHFGTAWYDAERIDPDGTPDTETAVDKFLECLRADENVHWIDIGKSKAENIGITLVAEYCQEISPQFEWVKVEATCEPIEITMPNNVIFEITGHVDRVYTQRVDGRKRFGVADLKSGYGVIRQDGSIDVAKHGVQLAVYELLEIMAQQSADEPMTLPALVIGLSTSGRPEIKWEQVDNPRSLLFGDGQHDGYLMAASKIIEHQLYVGNPRSMLCSEKYCPIYNDCFYRRGT